MNQPMTVGQLNEYVKLLIEEDARLNPVWVKGELSGVKSYPSGHVYFTLKDEKAAVSCVLFRGYATRLKFRLENGMKVILSGRATVYERDGRYQLMVQTVTPDGLGDLYLAFEELKKKLAAQGLFAEESKQKIPFLPLSVGVITSPAGAVIRDIIQVMSRRFYNFNLKLYPAAVQGEKAAAEIAHAVRRLNELNIVDLIIVGRGGGSLEDLWPFNEEIVARAVFASKIPVISAVGHETDFTICDFVADLRAPTPSAAAELAMPVFSDEVLKITQLRRRLSRSLATRLEREKIRLTSLKDARILKRPWELIDDKRQDQDLFLTRLQQGMGARTAAAERMISILSGRLNALSPLAVLTRGYGLVMAHDTGKPLRSTALIQPGDLVDITMADGTLNCSVNRISDRRI